MEKVVELFYQAYQEKYGKEFIEPEGFNEASTEFMKMLDTNQRHKYLDFEVLEFEFLMMHEKRAIQYMLELICPEY